MEAQLKELLPFLHDRNPQARQMALSHLVGHTLAGSPHREIFYAGLGGGLAPKKDPDVIRDLKLLCRDQPAIAHDAYKALINLSDSPLLGPPLSEKMFLTYLVSYIIHPASLLADLASMLLSNITVDESACSTLLSMTIPVIPDSSEPGCYPTHSRSATSPAPDPYPEGDDQDVPALPLLVDAFAKAATVEGKTKSRKGNLHFLASVFANISLTSPGRMFFVTPYPATNFPPSEQREFPLSKLVVFTEHPDTIRRGGTVSLIKNCSFEASMHKAMLSPESISFPISSTAATAPGVGVLQYILLPLAGPEEFEIDMQETFPPALQMLPPTKKREPDSALRLMHVETLLLLCTTRWGRDHLRQNGTYEIVRVMHEHETVDKVSEHLERLVVLLKGDESAELEDEEPPASVVDEDAVIEEI